MPSSSTASSVLSGRPGRSGEWVLGRVGGAPVVVSATSLLLGLVIAASWYPTVSRALGPFGVLAVLAVVVATVVGVALSVLLHELAHGLAGILLGRRPVRYELYLWGGRTSFEAASSSWTPWRDAVTSLAGPGANLVLWVVGGQIRDVLREGVLREGGEAVFPVFVTVWALTWVNLALAVFNALPGLPLDGGHALAALVAQLGGSRWLGLKVAAWGGLAVVAGMAWWWVLRPLLLYGRRLDSVNLVLVALVGWLIASTSWQVLGRGRAERAAAALDLRGLARSIAVTTSSTAVTEVWSLLEGASLVLVTDGPRLLGAIDAQTLDEVGLARPGEGGEGGGPGQAAGATAGQVCTVLPDAALTSALTGPEAAEAMRAARAVSRWLVLVDAGTPVGAVPTGAASGAR